MARKITMGSDWNAMRPSHDGKLQLWSRFAAEIAPDLIVTPLLFLTEREPTDGPHDNAYTLEPVDLIVLHARGENHLRHLLDEVAPRLAHLRAAYVLDADARTLHPADRTAPTASLDELPAILERAVMSRAPEHYADILELFRREQREAVASIRTRGDVDAFAALPAVQARIAEAAARAEANPLRLWEAMLFRGENYRWELVSGEVPLVGELWSPLAANRTLLQCIADAEHAFEAPATEAGGWIVCGPMRMRQRGTRVELRVRLAPADRRAAFLPRATSLGDDAIPTMWGALLCGGGSGKTEMIAGYTDSVVEVHPSQSRERVALTLADEIRRVTGAEVVMAERPREPGDAWHVDHWGRWVGVHMPVHRAGCLPWEIHAGLHLSDGFLFWRRREDG